MGSDSGPRRIRGIGEIALKVKDLDAMRHFYEEIVGLELWRAQPDHVFLRVADGVVGHTQVVVLFEDAEAEHRGSGSSLHHFAFEIDCEDFRSERERLEALGLEVSTDVHEWSEWRSLYILDPEGNEVEFVCCDRHRDPST